MTQNLQTDLQKITDTLYVEDNVRYDFMYNLAGGLGDIINQLFYFPLYEHILEQSKNKKIIINLCSCNPFSKEIFDYLPNRNNLKINIFDNYYSILSNINFENRQEFFKSFNKNNIDLNSNYNILDYSKEPNGYLDFYMKYDEKQIINNILKSNKKIIIFSPCSGKKHTTPSKQYCEKIIEYIPEEFLIIKIGRDYVTTYGEDIRYNTEYKFENNYKVIDLTNKLSVPATLELVKLSSGIITSDTSILIYSSILHKPMFLMLFNKKHHLYQNYKKNMHYYRCFEYENVVVEDWENTTENTIKKFINFI